MLFFYSIWLVPLVLTLLAWREGWRAIVSAGELQSGVRARTWPAMLFLAGPVAVALGYVGLRVVVGNMITASIVFVFVRMVVIGGMSSIAALASLVWAPPRFRVLALFAAAGWAACFGFVFLLISALRGLR